MSQDPNYVGPVGYEKKVHQTHFSVNKDKPLDQKAESMFEWIEIAPGKYRLVRKRSEAAERSAEVNDGIHPK